MRINNQQVDEIQSAAVQTCISSIWRKLRCATYYEVIDYSLHRSFYEIFLDGKAIQIYDGEHSLVHNGAYVTHILNRELYDCCSRVLGMYEDKDLEQEYKEGFSLGIEDCLRTISRPDALFCVRFTVINQFSQGYTEGYRWALNNL